MAEEINSAGGAQPVRCLRTSRDIGAAAGGAAARCKESRARVRTALPQLPALVPGIYLL